jgi:hypothetical protein
MFMRLFTLFRMLAFLSIGFALSLSGRAQTYSYSGPANGFIGMQLWNQTGPGNGTNPNQYICTAGCQFSMFTDTIYLDPIASTIRQTGFIGFSPSTATRTMDDTRLVGGVSIPATLTLNVAVTGGGISFDTGPLHYIYHGFGLNNVITGEEGIPPIAFDGSYSWVTGGQTYTDSFSYKLDFGLVLYDWFSVASDQSSLTLSNPYSYGAIGKSVGGTTAANGLALSLVTGGSDHASVANWAGSITATMIPEPGCISLFGLGLSVLAFSRRYRR